MSVDKDSLTVCVDCSYPVTAETAWIDLVGILCHDCYLVRYMGAEPTRHRHDWKEYIGFTHRYWYCDCGERKRHGKD